MTDCATGGVTCASASANSLGRKSIQGRGGGERERLESERRRTRRWKGSNLYVGLGRGPWSQNRPPARAVCLPVPTGCR
ncbi:hypothetical protein VFPFJ_01860 [Purpureocillium lilacinum]|uniref:Uncharacterized protein n=1 Tax=Purpureocillium lilacinum TaxID=33203 RepID=A0A179HTE8_PURLI|nr:hypothetical protein VFPFJ_01860 [Purpureocillium lilacinum]OAQ92699.1 hypothetical protein VFPFJ_01860 [Purpureocillium lilacinum]